MVVVGAGNVALDVVRVLVRGVDELAATDMPDEVLEALRTRSVRDVHLLARRGPAYTAFTTKELRELGELADLDVVVDPADLVLDRSSTLVAEQDKVAARNLAVLAEWAGRPRPVPRTGCTCTSGPARSPSSAPTASRASR